MDNFELVPQAPQKITLSTKAKRRMRTTREETEIFERFYAENTNPNSEQKKKIAELVKMGPKNVHFWFQNRRAKDNKKRKMIKKESDKMLMLNNPTGHRNEQLPRLALTEEDQLDFKESHEKLLSQQQQLENLKRNRYQIAATQLPPISTIFGQKRSQKDVGLDVPFVFYHPIYGIEAYMQQMDRNHKSRV